MFQQNKGGLLISALSLLITAAVAGVLIATFKGGSGGVASQMNTAVPTDSMVTMEPTALVVSTATATDVPDHSALCPQGDAGTEVYISEENGYCFLYPADFQPSDTFIISERDVTFLAPQHDGSEVYFFIRMMYLGTASDVETPQTYAEKWGSIHLQAGAAPVMEDVSIGGQSAVIMPDIWRMDFLDTLSRTAFVVANGQKYRIAMANWAGTNGNGIRVVYEEDALRAWETITGSLVFFPPADVRETIQAADVCPQAQEGAQVFISEWMGVCFAYPADFHVSPNNLYALTNSDDEAGQFVPEFMVAFAGILNRERAPLSELITASEYREILGATTIQGYEAILVKDVGMMPGPVHSTYIAVGEHVYQLMMSPYDRENRGDFDRIWAQVTESIRFFTPVW